MLLCWGFGVDVYIHVQTWTLQAMAVGPWLDAMIGEHRQLVTDEPVEFEK